LLQIRQNHKVFSRGKVQFLKSENTKVLSYFCKWGDDVALIVNNLSRYSQFICLDLSEYEGLCPVDLFGQTHFPKIGSANYMITLGAYGFYWFKLERDGCPS
jgi:maltose alpha-D-glucosyltransferase/alpha-amylase